MDLTIIYVTGLALVMARLGWHMYYHLDQFDWKYNKADIWASFALNLLLWPVLLLKPKNLLYPHKLFHGISLYDLANKERQLSKKREAIYTRQSPCGHTVSYRQYGTHCTYLIPSKDLAAGLRELAKGTRENVNHQALLYWLENSSPDISDIKPVPLYDDLLLSLTLHLHSQGIASAWCWECWKEISKEEAMEHQVAPHIGVNYKQYRCPKGHTLLYQEYMRIY